MQRVSSESFPLIGDSEFSQPKATKDYVARTPFYPIIGVLENEDDSGTLIQVDPCLYSRLYSVVTDLHGRQFAGLLVP